MMKKDKAIDEPIARFIPMLNNLIIANEKNKCTMTVLTVKSSWGAFALLRSSALASRVIIIAKLYHNSTKNYI